MARTLLLLRHAHAEPGAEDTPDRERALDARGRAEARAVAERVVAAGLVPERVLCSPARRALETLEPLRPHLAAPPETPETLYGASPGEILSHVQDRDARDDRASRVLVVGHNPSIAALARELAGEGDPGALARLVRYPPATLAVLVFDAPGISGSPSPSPSWEDLAPGRGRLERLIAPDDPPDGPLRTP